MSGPTPPAHDNTDTSAKPLAERHPGPAPRSTTGSAAEIELGAKIRASDLTVAYGPTAPAVLDAVSLDIEPGTVTAIVGPNGSGKSTLLRTLGRLRAPEQGTVLLDGADIFTRPGRTLARSLAVLPQSPTAPEGLRVVDLVARGRDPHRRWYDQWSRADEAVVLRCLERVAMSDLAQAFVDELSGGQRQRAWIAMALAQEASTILLDEPTTFLDIAHQLDVLELVASLNAENGATIVMVLHDLSMAARYADRIVALRNGRIVADGTPVTVITKEVLQDVFNLEAHIFRDQTTQRPHVIPIRRARSLAAQCLTQERSPG